MKQKHWECRKRSSKGTKANVNSGTSNKPQKALELKPLTQEKAIPIHELGISTRTKRNPICGNEK